MSVNRRFALDEKRYVIDVVNVANSGKVCGHDNYREDDKRLRERVLMIRLIEMTKKLLTGEYKPPNKGLDLSGRRRSMRLKHRS
jgi:hypothetical protein